MSSTIASSSSVSVPPFVSHRTSDAGAGLAGRAQRGEGVGAVGLVAVEVVLGVVDGLAAALDEEADRLGDHVEVLGRRGAEDLGHVEQPALAEDRDDRRLGGDELAQVRVGLGPVRPVAGRAEGGQLRPLPADRLRGREELDVLGVGAGPAALDVGHAVLVEHPGDAELVGERQDDVLALGAVAERRVVEDDGRGGRGSVVGCSVTRSWPSRSVGRRVAGGSRRRRRPRASGRRQAAAPAESRSSAHDRLGHPDRPDAACSARPRPGRAARGRPSGTRRRARRATAASTASAASARPSDQRRSIAAERIVPIGFARSRPAMSGRRAVDRLVQAVQAVRRPPRPDRRRRQHPQAARPAPTPRRRGCRRRGSR